MKSIAFSSFVGPLLALSLPFISLTESCQDDPHSSPDAHACHHSEFDTYSVEASSTATGAPEVATTQEIHGHFTVDLPRSGTAHQGYVGFEGLEDGDVYVVYWTEPSVELRLLDGETGADIPPMVYSENTLACDAFAGRVEFPVDARDYLIELRADVDESELMLEAWSQY